MIFDLDDRLEEKLRKTVADVKGLHKGERVARRGDRSVDIATRKNIR
jgi:hypothetical protein